MVTLEHTLRMLKIPVMDDGVVSLGETSLLLRAVRPYALKGDTRACELRDLLLQVRRDGIITPEESERVHRLVDKITVGGESLAEYVRTIPDFPKPGVQFRDVTGLLDTPRVFNLALDQIHEALQDVEFDVVAAPESRGFIFGAAIASRYGTAFVPIRKPGKLPRETISEEYALEYGTATVHMHKDAILPGERAIIVDDLLATGGTAAASARLVERLGGKVVKMVFPIELEGFQARANALKGYDVVSLVKYPGK